jgi:NAD(P)-dependent dehydrogenase (short-subunit alcohol dehydrogenase family)
MNDEQMTGYAVAIRMTCSNPEITQERDRRTVMVRFDDSDRARHASEEEDRLHRVAASCGLKHVLPVEPDVPATDVAEAVAGFVREKRAAPDVVAAAGLGVFVVGESGHETHAKHAALMSGERFRPAPRHDGRPGRLHGCAAIVTGSAQGFGKGIAEEMTAEDACVVVADINDPLGKAFRADLDRLHGDGTAVYHHTDVTEAASAEACVRAAVRAFGGLDILVSNAGVLKAGALDEMDEGAFDLVTRVNYKAYYLCVRAAAPVMKLQHEFNPHHTMDIVQINSKSGLVGSMKNFAYAGSKFGAIGLTQSFALELVPHRIKVNAVCPGNYFDGPLWSDPEKGLFVQYLKTGKVPGAQSIEDVKAFYLSKVPMKRGCTPQDVARAIFYLHDQEYETGQALPVTGGQVMLR